MKLAESGDLGRISSWEKGSVCFEPAQSEHPRACDWLRTTFDSRRMPFLVGICEGRYLGTISLSFSIIFGYASDRILGELEITENVLINPS